MIVKQIDLSSQHNIVLTMFTIYEIKMPHEPDYVYLVHKDMSLSMLMGMGLGNILYTDIKMVFGVPIGKMKKDHLIHSVKVPKEAYFMHTLSGEMSVEDFFKGTEGDEANIYDVTQSQPSHYEFRHFLDYRMLSPNQVEQRREWKEKELAAEKSRKRMQFIKDIRNASEQRSLEVAKQYRGGNQ